MRLYWIRIGLTYNDCVFIRKDAQTNTQKRMPCVDRGRA